MLPQVTDTIASVRRNRQYIDGEIIEDVDIRVHASREGARRSQSPPTLGISSRLTIAPQGEMKPHSKPSGPLCAPHSTHASYPGADTEIRAKARRGRAPYTAFRWRSRRHSFWRISSSCSWCVFLRNLRDRVCKVSRCEEGVGSSDNWQRTSGWRPVKAHLYESMSTLQRSLKNTFARGIR